MSLPNGLNGRNGILIGAKEERGKEMSKCDKCRFYDNCIFANGKFCDDCMNARNCDMRGVSCKSGYDIACDKSFKRDKDGEK